MRFVNTSTANVVPSRRPCAPASEVASSTQARSPASAISRSSRCRSIASGVFSPVGRCSPPTHRSMFVSRPDGHPAASKIDRSRNAVVVFPFVPVTPATSSSRDGSPKKRRAATGIAERTSATTSWGTPMSSEWSTTSAAAPSAAAVAAKAWPSAFRPRTQKKSAPGRTVRVS